MSTVFIGERGERWVGGGEGGFTDAQMQASFGIILGVITSDVKIHAQFVKLASFYAYRRRE